MFQYTHETILNDVTKALRVEGVQNPYTLAEGVNKIVVKRAGEYYTDCIVGDVYKTMPVVGRPGSLDLAAVKDALTVPGEYHFVFRVITPNQFYAEYASPNWQVFGKPMVIGFNVPKDADGEADKENGFKNLIAGIRLAIPEDNQFITVTDEGLVEGTSNYMTFDKPFLEYYDPTMCDSCQGSYIKVEVEYPIEKNVEDFATKQWIIENLRFPTYPNIRYASASDEMPTAEKYVEYAFTYSVPRVGLGGLSGVGQGMTANTRHIFYVPEADASTFEAVFEGLTIKTNEDNVEDEGETTPDEQE